jgi:hypothetical protein
MALIDHIRRSGLDGRSVLVGPAQLTRFLSRGVATRGKRFGLTGTVDQYEITSGASGTLAGTYIITVNPFSQNGLTARRRGVGSVILLRQLDGVATPAAAVGLVARRDTPPGEQAVITLPTVVAALGDRMFVLVELTGGSATRYELKVDFTAA